MEFKISSSEPFVLTKENAPTCYNVYLKCENRLLIETFERIKNNLPLYQNMCEVERVKIKSLIIPALLLDNIVKYDDNNKLISLKSRIIFLANEENKILLAKAHHTFSRDVCSKINSDNLHKYTFCEAIIKRVSLEDLKKYQELVSKLKEFTFELQESQLHDSYDCELSLMLHYDRALDHDTKEGVLNV